MAQARPTDLGSGSIPRLMLKLALPAVAAQLINVLYNIVDRVYIGNIPGIGDMALTGVGVTFPIIMIISAFSAFVGMGGAPLAAIRLGEGDRDGAETILGNGVVVLALISAALTVLFMLFKTPMLMAFGASANTIGYARDYLSIYLCGTIFVQLALGLNPYISTQGQATTAMLSVCIGAGLNILLDPLFIFVLGMGVRGAALATILSQAVSAAWVVRFLCSEKTKLRIRKKNFRLRPKVVGMIAALGVSPFIMQSTESLVQITLNRGLQQYGGDLYVGSMTIILSVLQLFIMPVQGFSQGAQPILSYNYGARNMDRVKKTFKLMFVSTLCLSTLACLAAVCFPQVLAGMFNPGPELMEITTRGMRIFMSGIFLFGAQLACQTTFLSLGQAKISVFIALLRKIILLIPLALALPLRFGVMGIYFAEPAADILAALTTVALFALNFKRILKAKEEEPRPSPDYRPAGEPAGETPRA